jgi:hypothetical protein
LALALLAVRAPAAGPPPLLAAQGTIEKVDRETLTVRPRGPDGKFGKSLALKLTGTSKISTLMPQTRAGKTVMTQKDTEPKDLLPKQAIAVLYTTLKDSPILLTAVVQPPAEK